MKKLIALIVCVSMIMLAGCGITKPGKENLFEKKETELYERPADIESEILKIYKENTSLGYGSVDHKFSEKNLEGYDISLPIHRVFIHPSEDDNAILDVAETLYQIDQLLADSKGYKKYCKKNGVPYWIEIACFDETVGTIEVTGELTKEEIKESLDMCMENLPDLSAYESFYQYLDTVDGLLLDDNGNYYYVIDTKNFDLSASELERILTDIDRQNPYPEGMWGNYVELSEIYGYPDKGITVYADEVSDSKVIYKESFKVPYQYVYFWMFDYLTDILKKAYANEDVDADSYYVLSSSNEETCSADITIFMRANEDEEITPDMVMDYAYDFYAELKSNFDEHGITKVKTVTINADFAESEETDDRYESFFDLDMSRNYERDEFKNLVKSHRQLYHPSDFIEPDDCE